MDIGEQAWAQRVRTRLVQAHDNYLRPMLHNLAAQFAGRYVLRAVQTWEAHGVYASSLQSLKSTPKNLVQRAWYCVMVDST